MLPKKGTFSMILNPVTIHYRVHTISTLSPGAIIYSPPGKYLLPHPARSE